MKMTVILNPRSKRGGRRDLQKTLREKFAQFPLTIVQTAYPGHATHVAAQAVRENVDTVVAVGGDGTVNEVLNGVMGADISLGVIPTGTANDLASLYHIPRDLGQACDVILEHHSVSADVIRVNGRHYVTAGGMGLPCEVIRSANSIRTKGSLGRCLWQFLGSNIYLLAVVSALAEKRPQGYPTIIWWDGCVLSVNSIALVINNQPFFGRDFLMSPGAVNGDGLLDICLIESSQRRTQTFSILLKVLVGGHSQLPCVKRWQARQLFIRTESSSTFFGDGEILAQSSEFSVKVIPGALKIIVPRARPSSRFS